MLVFFCYLCYGVPNYQHHVKLTQHLNKVCHYYSDISNNDKNYYLFKIFFRSDFIPRIPHIWRMSVRSNFEAEIKDKLTVTWNKVWHCSCKLCIGSATRLLAVSYEFKQRRFWPTHVNLSTCLDAIYQIWIANCFYFHRENRLKNLFKINAQIAKSPFPINDRPASLKKSRCLNSLGWPRVALSKEGQPLAV